MEENILNSETGRKVLAVVKASFKAADLVSDLVLREKIKQQALSVYKNFFDKKNSEILKEVDALDGLFHLGWHLGLVKDEHLRPLRNGLTVFKSHIILATHQSPKAKGESEPEKPRVVKAEKTENPEPVSTVLSSRHKKLLDKFSNKETLLQLSDFIDLFPDLSERTVRSDLAELVAMRKITRTGRGSGSYYKLL